jgi:hypothetical protein
MRHIIILCFVIFALSACSKKGTLNEGYWEGRMAGAYQLVDANVKVFQNGVLSSSTTLPVDSTYILLYTDMIDGFFNELAFYGNNVPPGLHNTGAWNMENDDRRITFSTFDGSNFNPTSSFTIDNAGGEKQVWHYITSGTTTYTHYAYTVVRNTKP